MDLSLVSCACELDPKAADNLSAPEEQNTLLLREVRRTIQKENYDSQNKLNEK